MDKKIFVLLVMAFSVLVQSVYGVKELIRESGNDAAHIEVAKELNRIEGVAEAAVISCEKKILVGITVFENADIKNVGSVAREIVAKRFSKIRKCRINIGNSDAMNVIELSGFIETELDKKMLKKRFEFLVERDRTEGEDMKENREMNKGV
ncbi:MAG: hypothetical protein IJ285_01900 [Clostridia bacterium]|nr:hypothetical protein [Clostridia bacterium]